MEANVSYGNEIIKGGSCKTALGPFRVGGV